MEKVFDLGKVPYAGAGPQREFETIDKMKLGAKVFIDSLKVLFLSIPYFIESFVYLFISRPKKSVAGKVVLVLVELI